MAVITSGCGLIKAVAVEHLAALAAADPLGEGGYFLMVEGGAFWFKPQSL